MIITWRELGGQVLGICKLANWDKVGNKSTNSTNSFEVAPKNVEIFYKYVKITLPYLKN